MFTFITSTLLIILILVGVYIMAVLSDVVAAVQANTDAINAAIAFIQANPPADPVVLQGLVDQLTDADTRLKAATTPTA